VVHSPGQNVPSFQEPSLRWVGAAFPQGARPRRSDEDLSTTFVPEEGVGVRELVEDLSIELTGRVVAIAEVGEELHVTIGEGGHLTDSRHRIDRLATEKAPRSRSEPAPLIAARALCAKLGIGFVSEENSRLPPGGWGLATMAVGRGKVRLPEGWVDQAKERFVVGPGRNVTGETFIGIWDRTSPEKPIMSVRGGREKASLRSVFGHSFGQPTAMTGGRRPVIVRAVRRASSRRIP
jgi:hypothetical protein